MIALAAALALGSSANISIPAGYYTLPEIAQRLSATCPPALADRLLFVSIHDRPLKEIEDDLSAALGVRFGQTAGGETIGAETLRHTQESRLRNGLIDYYDQSFGAVQNVCSMLLPNVTPESIQAESERLNRAQGDEPAQTAAKLLLDLGNGDFSPLAFLCISSGVDFDALMQSDALETGTELDLESTGPLAWRNRMSGRMLVDQNLTSLPISPDQREELRRQIDATTCAAVRLCFDPYTGRLESRLSLSFRCDSDAGVGGDFDIVPDEVPIAYPKLSQLGDETSVREYTARREETEKLLSSELGKQPVTTPPGSRSVSEFFAQWSAQSNRDVIMEVSPGRDLSPNRFETGRSVSSEPLREVLGSVAECESEVAGDNPVEESMQSRASGQALARAIAAEPTYTCRQTNGVLCVRDEFAFLDHALSYPVGAIAEFANARLRSLTPAPKLADIQLYSRDVSAEQAALVARFHCALVPTDVAAAWPILHAISESGPLRTSLEHSVTSGSAVSNRIDRIPAFSPAGFLQDLASAATGCEWLCGRGAPAAAICLSPDLGKTLQDSILEIQPTVSGSTGTVQFSIYHAQSLAFPRVGADGALTYVPEDPHMDIVLQWLPVQFSAG